MLSAWFSPSVFTLMQATFHFALANSVFPRWFFSKRLLHCENIPGFPSYLPGYTLTDALPPTSAIYPQNDPASDLSDHPLAL